MLRALVLALLAVAGCGDGADGPGNDTDEPSSDPGPAWADAVANPEPCVLDVEGTMTCATLEPVLEGVTHMDASGDRVCAMAADGVWCGRGAELVALDAGLLGGTAVHVSVPEAAGAPVAVTRSDGTLVLWDPDAGTAEAVRGMPSVTSAAVVVQPDAFTALFPCGIEATGTPRCLRINEAGLHGEGTPATWPGRVEAVDASQQAACVATTDRVQCGTHDGWAFEAGVAQLVTGALHGCVRTSTGGVTCFAAASGFQTTWDVDLPSPAVQISASGGSSCAVLDDGSTWCWTADDNGVLEPPTELASPRPGR